MAKKRLSELERPSVAAYRKQPKLPVVLVLDNVRSALNVGSAFRTADAFGIEQLYLCGITATPPHREILKTAIGATESVAWSYAPDTATLLTRLGEAGYRTIGIEQTTDAVALQEVRLDPARRYAFVLGNEVDGVSEAALAQCVRTLEVPQFGTKHSLNVAVCAGVVLWEAVRQLKFGASTARVVA